jgi:hypothetical protein
VLIVSIDERAPRLNRIDMTRPLCPYPQHAVYKGSGSIYDAANYACKVKN